MLMTTLSSLGTAIGFSSFSSFCRACLISLLYLSLSLAAISFALFLPVSDWSEPSTVAGGAVRANDLLSTRSLIPYFCHFLVGNVDPHFLQIRTRVSPSI